MGVLRERYDVNTGKVPWELVVGIGPTKISHDKYACKGRLTVIKNHNPTMSMTELLDPDNIGKIKFGKTTSRSLIGRRSTITPDEMTDQRSTLAKATEIDYSKTNCRILHTTK